MTADRDDPFDIDIMMSARPDGPAFVERMVDVDMLLAQR